MSDIICPHCFHHCRLKDGQTGFCRARRNEHGANICANYGQLTSLAMDPIEKKPLIRFYPGSYILSAGSWGCNLACPFCQNHTISMHSGQDTRTVTVMPDELVRIALDHPESIGIAFTYNEPLIGWEYVLDCAVLLRAHGLKTVLVTNGCIARSVMEKLIPYVDAMNIDLKGDRTFYKELNGDYDAVRDTIAYVYDKCHLEVTSLIIPGKNDSEAWIRSEAEWLASLDPDIVLHLSRYFPRYRYTIPATEKDTVRRLRDIAAQYLHTVVTGNMF